MRKLRKFVYGFARGFRTRRPPVDGVAFQGWRAARRIVRAVLRVRWAVEDLLRPRVVEEVEA